MIQVIILFFTLHFSTLAVKWHLLDKCLLQNVTDRNKWLYWYPCHMLPIQLWETSCISRSLPVHTNYQKGQSRDNRIILLFNSKCKWINMSMSKVTPPPSPPLTFISVFKPRRHKLNILRHCTIGISSTGLPTTSALTFSHLDNASGTCISSAFLCTTSNWNC